VRRGSTRSPRRAEAVSDVEHNVVTIRARRAPARQDGDEVIIDERPYGQFTHQLFLGDNLDAGRMTADLRDDVPWLPWSGPAVPAGSSGDTGRLTRPRPPHIERPRVRASNGHASMIGAGCRASAGGDQPPA
jgi:hypothetical protein